MKNVFKIAVIAIISLVDANLQAFGIKAVIGAIHNQYSQSVVFKSNTVKSGAEKAVLCEVPFVTYKENELDFVFGKPYTPKAALKIGFEDSRVFRIWRTELGFVGAFDRNSDKSKSALVTYDESVPKTLLVVDDASQAIIRLKVLIDACGKVSLKRQ